MATGSVAMPSKDPAPSAGMAAQPSPKVPSAAPMASADSSSIGSSSMGSSDVVSEEVLLASSEADSASLPQAARPTDIVRARAARPDLRAMRFMRELPFVSGCRGGVVPGRVSGSGSARWWGRIGVIRRSTEIRSGTWAPLWPRSQKGSRRSPSARPADAVCASTVCRQPTLTAISWMPLEPSGKGVARTAVWTSPSLLVARLATKCWPGSASHSKDHWRQ